MKQLMNLPLCFLNPVVSIHTLKELNIPLNEMEYLSIGDGIDGFIWIQALLQHGANPHYLASIGVRPFPSFFRQLTRLPIQKRGRVLALRKTDHDRYVVAYITGGIPTLQYVIVRYVHLALDQVELVLQAELRLFEHVGQARPSSPNAQAQSYRPLAEQLLEDGQHAPILPALYTDLIETYRLPFKIGQRFPVNQDYEVIHLRQAKGRVFAVGNLTTAYYTNPLDAKVAAHYTTQHIVQTLLACRAPHLNTPSSHASAWAFAHTPSKRKYPLRGRRKRF